MDLAKHIALSFSKDKSTKVGCVILGGQNEILSTGYNGMPRGINDDVEERHERPNKYSWFEHSERNAIYNAARNGIKLLGSRAYITSLCPCPDCTRALIQSGISEIFLEATAFSTDNPRAQAWLVNWPISKQMFEEADIQVSIIE